MSSGELRWEIPESAPHRHGDYLHMFGIQYVANGYNFNTKYSVSVICDTCGRECGRGAFMWGRMCKEEK